MTILNMVAEGKITAEEGESLLRTLDTLDESQQVGEEQLPSEDGEEGFVELSKSGAESPKDQGGLSREFRRVLGNSASNIERGAPRRRSRGHSVHYEEPRAQMSLETAEKLDLAVDSRHGDIDVRSWARNSLQIDYQITVWAGDEATAKEIASEIEIGIKPEKDASGRVARTSITTNYSEEWALWQNNRPRARVDYWLIVPQQANLELHNRHGDVSVRGLGGTTTISDRHGNVSLHAIDGDLNIDAHHSNVEADTVQGNVCFKGRTGMSSSAKSVVIFKVTTGTDTLNLRRSVGISH